MKIFVIYFLVIFLTVMAKVKSYAGIVVLGAAALGTFLWTAKSYYCPDSVVTTINDTQTKRYRKNDKYLIFTDAGVLENTDAWYRLKFRSSDIQGEAMKLKGKKVRIAKYGWRNGVLSLYPNVLHIEEVKQ